MGCVAGLLGVEIPEIDIDLGAVKDVLTGLMGPIPQNIAQNTIDFTSEVENLDYGQEFEVPDTTMKLRKDSSEKEIMCAAVVASCSSAVRDQIKDAVWACAEPLVDAALEAATEEAPAPIPEFILEKAKDKFREAIIDPLVDKAIDKAMEVAMKKNGASAEEIAELQSSTASKKREKGKKKPKSAQTTAQSTGGYTNETKVEEQMQVSLEYGNPQPQVQIVVQQPTTVGQQNIQSTNYTFANNNNVSAVQTVADNMAMNTNVGYFQPRDDTGEYAENMKPWDSDQQIYSFAACTEFVEEWQAKKRNIDSKASANTESAQINTVYHKQGAQRLIVKRKDSSSTLTKAKNNPLTKWGLCVACLGLLLIIPGAVLSGIGNVTDEYYDEYSGWEEEGEDYSGVGGILIGVGVALLVVAFLMIFCFQKRKDMMSESNLITQSIPIQAIFFVERFVQQTEQGKQSCCNKKEERTSYSEIAIGYNRSNLSNGFAHVHGASHKDYLRFKLVANQAYNLHQYINTIIDGTHPQIRDLGSNAMNALPSAAGHGGLLS